MKCSRCSTPILPNDRFCRKCGAEVRPSVDLDSKDFEYSEDIDDELTVITEDPSEYTMTRSDESPVMKEPPKTENDRFEKIKVDPSEDDSRQLLKKVSDLQKKFLDEESDIETRAMDEFSGQSRIVRELRDEPQKKNRKEFEEPEPRPKKKLKKKRARSSSKKKWIVLLIVFIAVVCLAALAFFYFYSQKNMLQRFTEEDATELVKNELDVFSSGKVLKDKEDDEDGSTDFGEDILKLRKVYIEETKKDIVSLLEKNKFSVSDEQETRISDILDEALTKASYEVEGTSRVTDDNFAVTVQVKPLELYQGIDQKLIRELAVNLVKERIDIMTDRSLMYSLLLDDILEHVTEVGLKDPVYEEKESMTVKVQKKDDGEWKANENDMKKAGESFLSTDGFLQNDLSIG